MDILEENAERIGQFLDDWIRNIRSSKNSNPPIVFNDCPLCGAPFADETKLQSHILHSHGDIKYYIKADDRIISEVSYFEEPPTELVVIYAGLGNGQVEMKLSGQYHTIPLSSENRSQNLESFIPRGYRGRVALSIRFGSNCRPYTIFCKDMPILDYARLDELVMQFQQPLSTDSEPTWEEFKRINIYKSGTDPMEVRYLSGFFEYMLGIFLEKTDGKSAGQHFERSFSYLRPFRTDLSHTALCILALKLNWFSILQRRCGPRSKFYNSRLFFNSEKLPKDAPILDSAPPQNEGLWVDPFLENLIEAVRLFYKKDLEKVAELIDELKCDPISFDRNNEDKLNLIEARTLWSQGDRTSAVRVYHRLLNHPQFGTEAEEKTGHD